jgi:hypothetical protein
MSLYAVSGDDPEEEERVAVAYAASPTKGPGDVAWITLSEEEVARAAGSSPIADGEDPMPVLRPRHHFLVTDESTARALAGEVLKRLRTLALDVAVKEIKNKKLRKMYADHIKSGALAAEDDAVANDWIKRP